MARKKVENKDDKRSQDRAQASLMVEVYEPEGKILRGVAKLINISEQGAGLESTDILPEKFQVMVRFLVGKKDLLSIKAFVVWSRPRLTLLEYGLRFDPIGSDNLALIQQFMQQIS